MRVGSVRTASCVFIHPAIHVTIIEDHIQEGREAVKVLLNLSRSRGGATTLISQRILIRILGRACQFFCVWGLEVGGDSVGVGGGELGEGLFPVGGGASLDEACGGCSFVGGFAGVCEALGGSFVFDVADGEP